jgi:hypothetical protein
MKKLFVFHMIVASIVSSARAEEDAYGHKDDLESVSKNNMSGTQTVDCEDNELSDDDFLNEIALDVRNVSITKQMPTYWNYAQIALHGCYLYCIEKPYGFCKVYLQKLRLLLKKRKDHDEKR